MKDILSLVLPARLENLRTFMEVTQEAAAASGLPPHKILKLEVALEEALVNVMHYAYQDETGTIQVVCRACDSGLFVVEITDTGHPFDMTTVSPPDLASQVEDRRIGGLGIHLIKSLIDEVSYRRDGGKNVLVLRMSSVLAGITEQDNSE